MEYKKSKKKEYLDLRLCYDSYYQNKVNEIINCWTGKVLFNLITFSLGA